MSLSVLPLATVLRFAVVNPTVICNCRAAGYVFFLSVHPSHENERLEMSSVVRTSCLNKQPIEFKKTIERKLNLPPGCCAALILTHRPHFAEVNHYTLEYHLIILADN